MIEQNAHLISFMPNEPEPDEWASPNNSEWVIGVDMAGSIFIVGAPNIHPSFFDGGYTAENIGFPPDIVDVDAGLYKAICSFSTSTDWETGQVDDWSFDIESLELIK